MSWATSEVVTVLTFLLPGLVGITIFYSLTSHPKPSEFERIIHALTFTIIVQGITWVALTLTELGWQSTSWPEGMEIAISLWFAILFALVAALFSNQDAAHKFLRKIGITKETSYPSEWYSAFYRYTDCYVVLHLKGERRLYGWPQEWPSHPDQGHFIIAEGEWLDESERLPLTGVSIILVKGSEVEMVEFLQPIHSNSP